MSLENDGGSLFHKFKKTQKAPEVFVPSPAAQPQALPRAQDPVPRDDGKMALLEAAVKELKAEIAALKSPAPGPAVIPPLPQFREPPPLPAAPPAELLLRLERAENVIEQMRREAAADAENVQMRVANAATRDEVKNIGLRISDLTASFDGLTRTFAREGELAARLERTEGALAEIKTLLPGQQAQLKKNVEEFVPREEMDAMRANVLGAQASVEEIKRAFARYSEEFSGVERECRKTLGEAKGYAKSAEQNPLAAQFDEYLKESVSRLGMKLAEVETSLHAGLADLSGRLMASEVLYKKIFTEAEERLKKGLEPQLNNMEGQLKWLRENLIRLSDDYTVVAERKMRALEGKYSAFEAIARRMDAIDAALKMGGRVGLP